MMQKKRTAKRMNSESGATSVRVTITFPPGLHEMLEEIAKRKKISLAWVVRDATEKYVVERRAAETIGPVRP